MKPKAIVFEFTSYKFEPENKRIFFNYRTEIRNSEPILFTEMVEFQDSPDFENLPKGLLEKIFQGLHLVLGVSYYKLHCATIVRHKYSLAKEETYFWNTVYKKGLGEFFYRNELNPKILPKFQLDKKARPNNFRLEKGNKFFVAVSGGKDSIVAAELLKKHGVDAIAVFVETQKKSALVDKVIEVSGLDSLKIKRYLDWKVFDKSAGYFQGHIPISAIYAFLAVLCCVVYKRTYFAMSNEHSSNFGNIKYKGENINHQWSKSFEFENLFQNYVKNFITPDVYYFSLLRPFYEIRIAELFSKRKKYFPYFSSCNKNFKIESASDKLWCGECPKCAFVFLLLSVFLEREDLINIFGKNLFDDKNLLPLFKDILGFGKLKPFDCVGTFEESRAALFLARERFKNDFAVKEFLARIKNPKKLVEKIFKTQTSNVPDYIKFLGMKNAAVLGYGKEGEVTENYLKKNFPELKIGILDQKIDKDYLKKQSIYDILVKTPGIAKSKIENRALVPRTTATNIFFSEIKSRGNMVIGVTGSKGKSTTASLIYHILKKSGKNVLLLGNIGTPMLSVLMQEIKSDTIFVLELSSYQLDDIKFSPNIAVVTNLFPEHMDYHKSVDNYYLAKRNIVNFQQDGDVLVYNPNNKKMAKWRTGSKFKAVPFAKAIPLKDSELPLIGEHNKDNIKAAISAVKQLGIKDDVIKTAIKTFKGLPHRMEFVGEFKGIKFYDDAISTTPESTIMAIKTLKNIDTIFLGGQDRGYDFLQLEKAIKKYKIRNIVLFPDSGKKIIKNKKGFNILEARDMEQAVKFAFKFTGKGGVCLLSCASPSYSLWKNFEEKGEQFQSTIKKWANEKAI
ncbi:MAG: UDP-N-acetylmuramoylalanine--D-glutamate ligase [Candidatus Staskawiczbacteria bacterium RIFCSPLOWO2_12_FULL_37_15]|uniref:Multifunctional fusion protein n=1 Tax=Candidatus Staskawiczbacteria bacterium RIFCSPLOWO2_12_FULL_37_15 TaxID=1802218 RepID=A0A1G2IRG7_9BACT|nr:MAG: UDP-N-acetylmuramoylalanine--D-glutamate ligase [Candidatus Staskawiczbacteria bacterium RIFCSPLOWO2_12_FULL_37_15]